MNSLVYDIKKTALDVLGHPLRITRDSYKDMVSIVKDYFEKHGGNNYPEDKINKMESLARIIAAVSRGEELNDCDIPHALELNERDPEESKKDYLEVYHKRPLPYSHSKSGSPWLIS